MAKRKIVWTETGNTLKAPYKFMKTILEYGFISIVFAGLTMLMLSCDSQSLKTSNEPVIKSEEKRKDTLLFDCFDGSQLEMNICSLNEFEYYDSILQNRYFKLINMLDSNLVITQQYKDLFEYHEEKNLKEAVIISQKYWTKLREQNSNILKLIYKGGTMENMVVNQQLTIDTKNRIRLIEELINSEI